MRADDCLGAAESRERRQPQETRPDLALFLPDSLDDELEVRRLDPALVGLVPRRPTPGLTEVDFACGCLIEHGPDKRRLDLDRLAR